MKAPTLSAIIEALDPGAGGKPTRFRIRAIRAGVSGNGVFYPDAVLREAVPLFANARVFAKSDADHLAGRGKDVRNLVGRLVDPIFVAGDAPDGGEIQATLDVLDSAGDIAARMREALARGMANLFGFSIDAVGTSKPGAIAGRTVRAVTRFTEVKSVDLIVEPGAGGESDRSHTSSPREAGVREARHGDLHRRSCSRALFTIAEDDR
jgi:hypothetical protein